MSNVKISLTSRPQRSIKLRPQLRFADEILKSSKCSTLTSDEQSPSGESIGSDYVAFSSPESSSSSRSQTDTKDFTAVFKVADKVRVMAQILDVDSLHLLAEILIPCLENMLRSFKRLSSRIRSTPDFGVAFRGAIFSGRMFAHHIEKVTTRLSGIQLADAIQLSLQSLDMMVESLKVLFGLIEHSVSEAKPLPNVPVVSTPNTTLARPLTPESSVENSPVPPMPYPEQAAVPLPLAMPITDGPSIPMPPTGKAATKGSLRRLVSGLGRRSSLGPLTLWSGTVFSKTPAMALALRVGGPPKGLVSTRPGMPGLSHSETSDQQTHISSAPPTTDQSTLVLRNLLQVLDKNQPSSTAELYFSSGGILCAASLAALVRILTSTEAIKDSIFDDFFFLSFRFFSSPIEIFNLLVAQYDEGPLGPLNSGHTILWEQDAPVAKVRVAKVFLLWLRRHWRYQWDADILEPLRQFVSNRPAHDPASITWGKVLRKLNEASSANYRGSRIQQTAETGVTHDAPANLPRPFGLLAEEAIFRGDFDEVDIIHFRSPAGRKELARQLCLAASELFRHIDPEDAVRYWNDGRDKKAGERILQLASFENAQAYWTSHSIVIRPTARSRAEVMELFTDLASVSKS